MTFSYLNASFEQIMHIIDKQILYSGPFEWRGEGVVMD